MTDGEKTLDIILRYGVDGASLGQTQAGVSGVTKSLEAQEAQLRKNRMVLRELSQVFTMIGVAGAAVWVPAIAAANEYVKTAGRTEQASGRWLYAQKEIGDATVRIGRVVVTDLLPGFEKAAQIAEKFAAWVEKNPKAVGAALSIAGGLVAVAAAGKIFTEVDRAIVDIQLIAATMMKKAADEQLAAATYGSTGGLIGPAAAKAAPAISAGGGLIAGLLGVGAGVAGYDVIAGLLGLPTAGTIGKETAAVAAYYIGNMFKNVPGQAHPGDYLFNQIAGNNGQSSSPSGVFKSGTGKDSFQKTDEALMGDYIAYQKGLATAQKTYDDAIKAEDAATKAQLLQLQDNYSLTITNQIRDFSLSESRTEQDYYAQRLKSARDNGQQAYKAEQDHQIAIRRLTEDHHDTMLDLTAARDGLGMIREMRSYEKTRTRAEQDYSLAESRRSQDYSTQLVDMENNFALQRSRRWEDMNQRLTDEAAANAAQIKAIEDADKDKKAALLLSLQTETSMVVQAFGDREAALGHIIDGAGRASVAMLKYYNGAFNAYLAAFGAAKAFADNSVYKKDTGGYAGPGVFANMSGRNEWVLDPSTTKYAEQIVGGRLTQQNLIAAMISGRGGSGGGGGTTYNDRRTQNLSGMTAQDRLLIKDMIKRGVNDKFEAELR
jgi:hypothetical protein